MNFTAIFGFAAAAAVIWFGVVSPAARPQIFLDQHALILVLGGTAAAALIGFPLRRFRDLFSFIVMGVFFPSKKKDGLVIEQILMLAHRPDVSSFTHTDRVQFHPFLLEGYVLLQQPELTTPEFKMIINSRRQRFQERYSQDAKLLQALAKFPPAFGLVGATTGMIAMMSGLGASGKDSIGPAMAIALVATFWGIALANLVLLPLADHAARLNSDDAKHRLMIATGLTLIHAQSRPAVVLEHLLGFLPVPERVNVRLSQSRAMAQQKQNKNRIRIIDTHDNSNRGSGSGT